MTVKTQSSDRRKFHDFPDVFRRGKSHDDRKLGALTPLLAPLDENTLNSEDMGEVVRFLDNSKCSTIRRKFKTIILTVAFIILPMMLLYSHQTDQSIIYHSRVLEPTFSAAANVDEGFLVWTPHCRIQYIDPFSSEAMAIFQRLKYVPCTTTQLTYLTTDKDGNTVLNANTTHLEKQLAKDETFKCCYSRVSRPKSIDTKIIKSQCTYFNTSIVLGKLEEFVMVKCERKYRKHVKKSYDEVHTNIQISNETQSRLDDMNLNNSIKPWNILIIGIDTLSRINFARAMPKTNKYLLKNKWLDFQGYNKIDDNTYPNLMAILTGKNQSRARKTCDGTGEHSQDNCRFMWKRYHNVGYVTAYGEDYIGIDTFGMPLHKGFVNQPTDHYLRPLLIAAEKASTKSKSKVYCTGQYTSGELVYNYAMDFISKYENHPNFGFFWTNTFSHDDISTPSKMDDKMLEYFIRLNRMKVMNTTVILFLGDHGIRFGKLRPTITGYHEERLPALFVWLPPPFRERHPEFYDNMLINTKRLTSPYDVYMTLEDLLRISEKKTDVEPSEACPTCHTLFRPMSLNRTCEDAGISPHWCACRTLQRLPPDHLLAKRAINFILDVEIESALNTTYRKTCRKCSKLSLNKIYNVYTSPEADSDVLSQFTVVFSTSPGNMEFESTVRYYKASKTFKLEGIVSRLTKYEGKGNCVSTAHLKKYCHCDKKCH